jgi:hypothetical protein
MALAVLGSWLSTAEAADIIILSLAVKQEGE